MLRASQMASEEALPAVACNAAASFDDNAALEHNFSKIAQSDKPKAVTYGLTVLLPSIKHKYPKAVIFILITKFFEAFAANGIRTILALYLRDDLYFSEIFSTSMLHIFNFFGQFCPIFGAVLADSYWGNVKTISTFCFLYAFGWILLIMTSFPNMGVSLVLLVSISLLFIAVGNGSIRACITSLGATQFKLPEQGRQLAEYFSFYYFVYYFGIFVSKIVPPAVRANTQCFNKSGCYPAVFGTLGASFMASWVIFSFGKFFYKSEKMCDDNILLKFYECIKYALIKKWRSSKQTAKPDYWLHNAYDKYESSFVNDVSRVLKLCKLFIPLPIYFALLAQQDSSWTFQASMMNTTVAGIKFQPDQAKAMGPIFLFMLIPLWQYVCVPLLKRCCNFELQPLHSVSLGGLFSTLSFLCAGVLQKYMNDHPFQTVNIVWQIPQFLLIMLGELLLSIPGLQFAFTQAPASMKSVVTAAWFLNNAFGNLIVVVIAQLNVFNSQSSEYFFYAILMLVGIILFTLMAYTYALDENTGHYYTLNTSAYSALKEKPEDNIPSSSNSKHSSSNLLI